MDRFTLTTVFDEGPGYKMQLFEAKDGKEYDGNLLKIIDLKEFSKSDADQFIYEVEILSTIKHPLMVPILEFFVENELLIIRYGTHLNSNRSECGMGLLGSTVCGTFQGYIPLFLELFNLLHSRNIVVRSFNPHNIYSKYTGCCEECGYSPDDEDLELILPNVGTEGGLEQTRFSSPSIILDKEFSFETDFWSLGCFYYLATYFENLFPSPDKETVIDQVLNSKLSLRNDVLRIMLTRHRKRKIDVYFLLEQFLPLSSQRNNIGPYGYNDQKRMRPIFDNCDDKIDYMREYGNCSLQHSEN